MNSNGVLFRMSRGAGIDSRVLGLSIPYHKLAVRSYSKVCFHPNPYSVFSYHLQLNDSFRNRIMLSIAEFVYIFLIINSFYYGLYLKSKNQLFKVINLFLLTVLYFFHTENTPHKALELNFLISSWLMGVC